MTYDFGDVLVVEFPFTDGSRSKRRPAVVVSSAGYNGSSLDVILLAVTSQIGPSGEELEAVLVHWQAAGLAKPSALKPVVFTLERSMIRQRIGVLESSDVLQLRGLLSQILG